LPGEPDLRPPHRLQGLQPVGGARRRPGRRPGRAGRGGAGRSGRRSMIVGRRALVPRKPGRHPGRDLGAGPATLVRARACGADVTRQPLRLALLDAERRLAAAGVASPRVDAELLAAHVVGVPRGRLVMVPLVDEPVLERYRELVARRAAREPLQHLLGTVVFGPVTLAVGPGVFTP